MHKIHVAVLVVLAGVLTAAHVAAYQVQADDQLVRAGVGGTFNFIRHRQVTRETPASQMALSLGYEYALSDAFAVTGTLRPGLAERYLELPLAGGMRYRFNGLGSPVVPYGALDLTFSLGLPLGPPPPHLNMGLRAALGLEYFVVGDFGLGVEFALESGPLFMPAFDLESSAELMLACGYRF